MTEFDGDHEALTELVRAAKGSPGQLDYVAANLRATRAEREAGRVRRRARSAGDPGLR